MTTTADTAEAFTGDRSFRRSIGSRPGTDSLGSGRQMIAKKTAPPTPEEAENIRRSVASKAHDVEDYKRLMWFLGIEPQRGGEVLWWK